MSDYQIDEKVFVVGTNKHGKSVVVPVMIVGKFCRNEEGQDCYTISANRLQKTDSRKLFKCEEDAVEFAVKNSK